jgi:hypothetical protein
MITKGGATRDTRRARVAVRWRQNFSRGSYLVVVRARNPSQPTHHRTPHGVRYVDDEFQHSH